MKVLWLTDLHLKEKDKLGLIENGVSSRLQEKLNFLDYIVNTAIEEKVDFVIDGGDIFDPRTSSIPAELRKLYVKHFILPLSKTDIKVRILGTNHGADGDFNAIDPEALLFPTNIKLITKVGREEADENNLFWYVPYGFKIPEEAYSEKTTIFGHFALEGVYPDPHAIAVQHEKIKIAIIGHIHNQQIAKNQKIYYTGASFPNNFGEIPETPGARFIIWNFDESLPIPDERYFKDVTPVQYFKLTMNELPLAIENLFEVGAIIKIVLKGQRGLITKISEAHIHQKFPEAKEIYIDYDIDTEMQIGTVSEDVEPEKILTGLTALTMNLDYLDFGLKMLEKAKGLLT